MEASTRLLRDGICGLGAFHTYYNDNPAESVPYTGLLFSVSAREQHLKILTIELDLRWPLNLEDDSYVNVDTSIEVYTYDGQFQTAFSDESQWKLVANTTVVRNPLDVRAGAIIPADDFDTVTLEPNERKSFYITMKSPLIDFTSDKSKGIGKVAIENDDLSVYAGAGLTEYKFPSTVDTSIDPQFAGVIHYNRLLEECELRETTMITYQFMLKNPSATVMEQIANRTDQMINDLVRNDLDLREIHTVHELVKAQATTAQPADYNGECADGWFQCFAVDVNVSFTHLKTLSSGSLTYQMYQYAETLDNLVQEEPTALDNIIYVGYQDVAVDFELTLSGVPVGATMDWFQRDYFSDTSQAFLDNAFVVGPQVLRVQIAEQFPLESRRELEHLRRQGRHLKDTNGSLRIVGTIFGARHAYSSHEAFANSLGAIIDTYKDQFVSNLSFRALLPGAVAQDGRSELFRDISSVQASFEASNDKATPGGGLDGLAAELESIDSWVWMAVGGVAVGLIVIVIVTFYCVRRRMTANRKEEETRKMRRNDKRDRSRPGKKGPDPGKRQSVDGPPNDLMIQPRPGPSRSFDGRMSDQQRGRPSGRSDSYAGHPSGPASTPNRDHTSLNEPRAIPRERYTNQRPTAHGPPLGSGKRQSVDGPI